LPAQVPASDLVGRDFFNDTCVVLRFLMTFPRSELVARGSAKPASNHFKKKRPARDYYGHYGDEYLEPLAVTQVGPPMVIRLHQSSPGFRVPFSF
jgi:hypothetical protein